MPNGVKLCRQLAGPEPVRVRKVALPEVAASRPVAESTPRSLSRSELRP